MGRRGGSVSGCVGPQEGHSPQPILPPGAGFADLYQQKLHRFRVAAAASHLVHYGRCACTSNPHLHTHRSPTPRSIDSFHPPQAFEQDWDGAAPRQKPQTAFHAGQPDWVRPGRFMATLQSTVVHLAEPDAAANAPVIARLEQIRSEAMVVLDRMHGGTARPEDLQQGAVEAVEAAGAGEEPGEGQEQEQEEEWVTVVSSAAGRSEKARAEEEAMAQAKRAMGLGPGDVVEAVEAEIGPDGVVRRVGGGEGEGL